MEPMSTGASVVIMVDLEQPPLDAGMFNILIIAMVSERDLNALISSIGKDPKIDGLLKRVEELGGEVHAATLTTAVELLSPERDIAAAMVSSFNPPVGTYSSGEELPCIDDITISGEWYGNKYFFGCLIRKNAGL